MQEPESQPAWRDLALVRWAARFERGSVTLEGQLPHAVRADGANGVVLLPPGPLHIRIGWVGGAVPAVRGVAFREGSTSVWVDSDIASSAIEAVLDSLSDVHLAASADLGSDLVLRLAHGFEARIPAGVALKVTGALAGSADDLRLREPLVVGFNGEGLRLSHDQFHRLTRLANVRFHRVTLTPDGTVALEAHGARAIDRALHVPLQKAAERLTDLVRRSALFQRVRSFLDVD